MGKEGALSETIERRTGVNNYAVGRQNLSALRLAKLDGLTCKLEELWCCCNNERTGSGIMSFDLAAGARDVLADIMRMFAGRCTLGPSGIVSW